MLNLLKDIFPTAVALLTIGAIIYIILLPFIASWKLFQKVGIQGWKALIPIYNIYLIFKIAGMSGLNIIPVAITEIYSLTYVDFTKIPNYLFSIIIAMYIISFVINIIRSIKLSKVFGKGKGFMVGMILLPEIFQIILGMGKAKYQGSYKPKESK